MPLGWAIVSTGRHPDTKMAPAIAASEDAALTAVLSRDQGRAEAFASKHGAAAAYTDLHALLADPGVDIVYVASPNALHAEHTLKAAAAGKHVLVEKPMALTESDCQAMIDACERAGVLLGVGFHLRNHPGHTRLREIIAGDGLGTISFAEANWGRGTRGQVKPPPRPELQAWWDDPSLVGAGAFMATGVHCVDTLRYVLGSEVVSISAYTDATADAPLEELVTLSLRFASGALGTVMTGRRTPDYPHNDVVAYGSLGRGGVHGSIDMNYTGSLSVRTDAIEEDAAYGPDAVELYTRQVDAFCRAVREGGQPPATGVDGLRAAQITLAMVESARTGRRIDLA